MLWVWSSAGRVHAKLLQMDNLSADRTRSVCSRPAHIIKNKIDCAISLLFCIVIVIRFECVCVWKRQQIVTHTPAKAVPKPFTISYHFCVMFLICFFLFYFPFFKEIRKEFIEHKIGVCCSSFYVCVCVACFFFKTYMFRVGYESSSRRGDREMRSQHKNERMEFKESWTRWWCDVGLFCLKSKETADPS